MIELQNGRVSLALHTLQEAQGVPLLLLHELGGSADDFRKQRLSFAGSIYAVDLSGHGHSGRIFGAGYYPEMWAADADAALDKLVQLGAESIVVLGRGLGAYVALLLAGARPEQVCCAVLCEGQGLFDEAEGWVPGDAILPDLQTGARAQAVLETASTDQVVLKSMRSYPRPPAYATGFASRARRVRLVESGAERPAWWHAIAEVSGVERVPSVERALDGAVT